MIIQLIYVKSWPRSSRTSGSLVFARCPILQLFAPLVAQQSKRSDHGSNANSSRQLSRKLVVGSRYYSLLTTQTTQSDTNILKIPMVDIQLYQSDKPWLPEVSGDQLE